ncbi:MULTISPECIES: hypothetical protein [Salinibaculum]|uniref:hypothetical protein n=1 Tax=Salinibaculum TaxID=2732368 RepID=UPI0030CD083D
MNLRSFTRELADQIRYQRWKAIPWVSIRLYERFLARRFASFDLDRTNVYDRDWNVLLVLDACRLDLMQELEPEYPFLQVPDSILSVGATSSTWMRRTFVDGVADEIARTAYVNANPHSELELDPNDFALLDNVWEYAWDENLGTVPARSVTDRAIATWRNCSPDQMLVHYMQPHAPFVNHPELASGVDLDRVGEKWTGNVWDRLRTGELSADKVWEAYKANLRYVLDDISLLLDNIDAETVVLTADHGNAFGEYGFYGHNPTIVSSVIRVPWYTTSAEDIGEYTPTQERERSEADLESRLKSLGYV